MDLIFLYEQLDPERSRWKKEQVLFGPILTHHSDSYPLPVLDLVKDKPVLCYTGESQGTGKAAGSDSVDVGGE